MGVSVHNSGMENRHSLDSHFKVLVVDDHPNTAHMLARAISRLGSHVEVVSATSGLEALQYIEDGAADILITDMMMPEMTGMELIEKLNDDPSLSPSVTFLLTAHDSAGVREIAQRLNVREVLSKPAHPEQICELISQTIYELKQSNPADDGTTPQNTGKKNPAAESKQENLNVSQLLWEVAKKFQAQADIKNQLLVVGKTTPDLMVRGNAVQLRQALRTLVWTAIQTTPKGGSVILSSENGSNMLKVCVRDTGYGNNGFEDTDGNDQDLETVKAIVKEHGGDVTVEREPGKGTCFTLSLPLVHLKKSLQIE